MKENLSQLLESIYGNPIQIKSFEAIGGGCINETQALKLSNGERVFLKSNPSAPKNFFTTYISLLQKTFFVMKNGRIYKEETSLSKARGRCYNVYCILYTF